MIFLRLLLMGGAIIFLSWIIFYKVIPLLREIFTPEKPPQKETPSPNKSLVDELSEEEKRAREARQRLIELADETESRATQDLAQSQTVKEALKNKE